MLTSDMAVLVRVWREGSIAGCARAMRLSVAQVSAALRRVECQLGFVVFEREGKTARPLPCHLSLLHDFEQILDTLDRMPVPASGRGAGTAANLRRPFA
jgi:DNA-binding transcriptional LysR family regulator